LCKCEEVILWGVCFIEIASSPEPVLSLKGLLPMTIPYLTPVTP